MSLYRLNKSVIAFEGDPERFLNGLTSNTLQASQNALLNIHGRIIAVFEQITISEREHWIVIDSNYRGKVSEHLERYLRLGGVQMRDLGLGVYFDPDGSEKLSTDDRIIPFKSGQLILTKHEYPSEMTEDQFTLYRLQHHWPLQGVDFDQEMVLNVSPEEYVSFTKGCFLGQEPVSKVHHRSKPTWKLVVRAEDECSDEDKLKMTSKVMDPSDQKTYGFLFVKNTADV